MSGANRNAAAGKLIPALVQLWLPVVLLLAWWYLGAGSTSFYFPAPQAILDVFWHDITQGRLGLSILVSLMNLLLGLAIAIGVGVGLGLLIGEVRWLRIALYPTLNFLRSVPPAAIVPIVIVAMGIGSAPKIFIVALGCCWPILLNTIDGVRAMPESLSDTTRAFRIPPFLKVFKVSFMVALPQIMAGIRIAVAVAFVLMVISEFFGAKEGLGFYIRDASERFSMTAAWAGTIVVGLLGYLFSALFLLVERRVLAWYFQDVKPTKNQKTQALAASGRGK